VAPVRCSKAELPSTESLGVNQGDASAGNNEGGATDMVMTLLHEHIPLSLLYDLSNPEGPESWEILAVERGWLDPQSLDRRRCAPA
jgi:hypothetical protein